MSNVKTQDVQKYISILCICTFYKQNETKKTHPGNRFHFIVKAWGSEVFCENSQLSCSID